MIDGSPPHRIEIQQNHRQKIVEIVGNTAGQAAQRIHLLRDLHESLGLPLLRGVVRAENGNAIQRRTVILLKNRAVGPAALDDKALVCVPRATQLLRQVAEQSARAVLLETGGRRSDFAELGRDAQQGHELLVARDKTTFLESGDPPRHAVHGRLKHPLCTVGTPYGQEKRAPGNHQDGEHADDQDSQEHFPWLSRSKPGPQLIREDVMAWVNALNRSSGSKGLETMGALA